MSLTGGQPLAGQIRSRRICPSLAAFLQLELFRVYWVWIEKIGRFLKLKIHKQVSGFYFQ
ncbi:hypothetical protein EH206_21420 [Brenneria nigrifluens DSM 30175 = ATCC 13028]|uniref:Uncharacterized protein n=1 Tax=Brenneria nigrifluens DSM 30175 = ATCC 13028 TaxID=1121120 RepID=A0A2U1UQS4_9GAMM|nr:hypothetical protein DDT54_11775 [Brenneria nigrifluens DSM 30175 = ATCC 13028]QCR07052.1 hypothetical protein EH206_21420 [Brenneria nigrifluens DSM 30175 = ATCC 13028]